MLEVVDLLEDFWLGTLLGGVELVESDGRTLSCGDA